MNSERWHRRARATGDLLYGVRPIMEALDAGREIERITVQDGLRAEGLAELTAVARQRGIPVKKVPSEWFLRLGQRNHQGVVASISPIVYQRLEGLLPMIYEWGEDPLLILLDGVTDVRNLGAIARTAEGGVPAQLGAARGGRHGEGRYLLPPCRPPRPNLPSAGRRGTGNRQ